MVFYNWNLINRELTKGAVKIQDILRHMVIRPKYPRSKSAKELRLFMHDWKAGYSFLVSPDTLLLKTGNIPERYLIEYLELASYRSYGDYKVLNKLTLDFLAFEEKEDIINENPLLEEINGEIHFLYEGKPI